MSVPWLKGSTKRSTAGRVISTSNGLGGIGAQIFSGGVKDPTGKTTEYSSMEDECPVCKSDRYLNPKLRLLVSTCYHKMCESCIDRLFTLGPAPCPICGKTLRKMQFSPQTFEDLVVEKEVAVRRRMAKEFNKRREDFPDLKSFNDYLEEVEDITFNLINGIDTQKTEERIAAFRAQNATIIELNIQRDEREAAMVRVEEERLKKEQADRAEEARLEEEEERKEREKRERDIIDGLQQSNASASKIIARTRAEAAKRAKVANVQAVQQTSAATAATAAQRIRSNVKDIPHVPFTDPYYSETGQGVWGKFTLKEKYVDPGTDGILRDVGIIGGNEVAKAGGYDVREVWERAVRMSIEGLGIGVSQLSLEAETSQEHNENDKSTEMAPAK
ncbi:CDK-activating kinase assembly factor MAT1-domain-containing protein [Cantharellus anzutake]|uniref:CDK-activating kinase assembly factor MAT1-domain-containing protein n=1 Tax=Cantharellus anzutake TaxID=1750568 RepID=UPI0019031BF4|nr:CDK-activating kinase assembly factor MAT1-domain-containing protein [Cantharellus anzutake]XP_038910063.1 CDK-activating kinase assembly factor MAT1-domain-containing protein [Cantharellus anzutake]KAF8315545.1 CDK-activating kinase assembly factor MAT1-domain-containing protein [Cantharellus anzutake]KAF8319493.1 CDK-activating kinase assembly factor MAT1-domain-containing protein [Cantharellus anzutake]